MFAYLWEPCCPGETWSCSERGEAAAAGRGQTWPPVARSEQGWQGTEDRGWGGDCCVTILTEDIYIYTSYYLPLIGMDNGGEVQFASEAVIASCMLQSWGQVLGQNIGLSERTMERNR